MKKIMTSIIVMVLVVFSSINVKASGWDYIYNTIEKENTISSEIYDTMPTEIKKGDIITVKLMAKNVKDWNLIEGTNEISWDDKAFSLVETNGKHYRVVSDHIALSRMDVLGSNKATIHYTWKNENISENDIDIIEIDFKVKKSVSDGIYNISLKESDEGMRIYVENNYYSTAARPKTLKYQVGSLKITSDYSKNYIESMSNDVYIIGDYLFTRGKNEEAGYNGSLTTEFIMLAAKSIESDNKDDMKIYLKNAFGEWKNAISNTSITPPDSFQVKYIDMQANYLENGVYADDNYKNLLRLVQINENEAIVTIETEDLRLHGIATVNNKTITLKVDGTNYNITIGNNTVSVLGETLAKKTNLLLNDYFNETYAMSYYSGYDAVAHYLNSEHTGRYSFDNYEIYLLRVGENTAKACVREKGQTDCVFDGYIQSNNNYSWNVGSEPTTYAYDVGNNSYGLNWNNNEIEFICFEGSCDSYAGVYTKEQGLTMEDVFHLWEKNTIQYGVTIDENNGKNPHVVYVSSGSTLNGNNLYYEPSKNNAIFIEWQIIGNAVDFDDQITGPIVLEAVYRDIPGAPSLPVNPTYNSFNSLTNQFEYKLSIELDADYDGFDIFRAGSTSNLVATANKDELATVIVEANTEITIEARAFIMVGEEKHYGVVSNAITLHPESFAVTFDSTGGSSVSSIVVPSGETIERPSTDPVKAHYNFVRWLYNNNEFDFSNTPIMGNMTLVAEWERDFPDPTLVSEFGDNFYERRLSLGNYQNYCANSGNVACSRVSSDTYKISKYELFEKVNDTIQTTAVVVGGVSQFNPDEYIVLNLAANVDKHYVVRVFVQDGTDTIYSNYSNEIEIDTTIPAPVISFDPTAGTPSSLFDVENWIKISDLTGTYGFIKNDVLSGYRIDGFTLYSSNDPDSEIQSYGPNTDTIHVTANYGDDAHFYLRAKRVDGDSVIYSDFSNELILDTTAPVCYIDGSNAYHWQPHPDDASWLEVNGVTSGAYCHDPVCYKDTSDVYHWERTPGENWTEVTDTNNAAITSQTNCHAPVCYKDGSDEYHWGIVQQEGWSVVPGVSSSDDCHASNKACYFDLDESIYYWTDDPNPAWIPMPDLTSEDQCA